MTIIKLDVIPPALEYAIMANCILAGPDNLKKESETKLRERIEAGRIAVRNLTITETSYEDAVAYDLSMQAEIRSRQSGQDFWRSFRDLAMSYDQRSY